MDPSPLCSRIRSRNGPRVYTGFVMISGHPHRLESFGFHQALVVLLSKVHEVNSCCLAPHT